MATGKVSIAEQLQNEVLTCDFMDMTWIYFSLDSYSAEAWNDLTPLYYKEGM